MMDKKSTLTTALIVAASLTPAIGQAAPTTFIGENLNPGGNVEGDPVDARQDFLSNLAGGVGTEDFEDFSLGDSSPINLSFPGSSGSLSATLQGGGTEIDSGNNGFGRFPTSGNNLVETAGGGGFEIDFADPISAFGFFGTDVGDFSGELILELTNASTGAVTEINVGNDTTSSADGALLFAGFVDSDASYSNIAFENTDTGTDVFGFDDMTIGDIDQVNEVPAPAPLVLMGLGLLGLGLGGRRRR